MVQKNEVNLVSSLLVVSYSLISCYKSRAFVFLQEHTDTPVYMKTHRPAASLQYLSSEKRGVDSVKVFLSQGSGCLDNLWKTLSAFLHKPLWHTHTVNTRTQESLERTDFICVMDLHGSDVRVSCAYTIINI